MPRWRALLGLAMVAAGGCGSTAEPEVTDGRMLLTIRRGAASPTAVSVDSVDLLAEPADSGAVMGVAVGAPFAAGADSVRLEVVVPMAHDVATMALTVRLFAAGRQTFETRARGSVRRGTDTEVPPIEPASWQQLAGGPGPHQAAALVRAPPLGGTILFGGIDQNGSDGSTWVFDGAAWAAPQLAGPTPPGRHGHAMAFDEVRSEVVMFGGRVSNIAPVDETWVLRSAGWMEMQPVVVPPARTAHAMAYDRRRDEVVLFGGLNLTGPLDDTWIWDGATWRPANPSNVPPPRSGHTMVWSPSRQRIVLFGGSGGDVLSDVWEWDGTGWHLRELQGSIPPRREHAAAWDAARDRLVVFGGLEIGGVPLEDMWELADNRWTVVEHAHRPSPRFGPSMVDAGTQGILLFGGRGMAFLDDFWMYR